MDHIFDNTLPDSKLREAMLDRCLEILRYDTDVVELKQMLIRHEPRIMRRESMHVEEIEEKDSLIEYFTSQYEREQKELTRLRTFIERKEKKKVWDDDYSAQHDLEVAMRFTKHNPTCPEAGCNTRFSRIQYEAGNPNKWNRLLIICAGCGESVRPL